MTGVQTVTWLLWSALTTNEKRQTITGDSGGGGTRHSITTKPMTCHLFNNIYSAEDCNPGHLRCVSLKCHVLVTSQPLRQASKTNIWKRHRRIRISHFFTCNIVSPLRSGDKKKKTWTPPFWCLFTMRQRVTVCAFSGLAGSEYLKGDNYHTGKNQFISGLHDNVCACVCVCVCVCVRQR